MSRRDMLLAAGAGAAAVVTQAAAQERRRAGPAVATKTVRGLPFRAFVRHGTQGEVLDLKLRDITPTQVVVRTRGSCGCYTVTTAVLGDAPVATPNIPNHSGMGIVEAVGAQVRRVRVGDRVLVSGTPWCGHCHQCLSGTPEWCNYLAPNGVPNDPIADMADKTGVIEAAVIGGLSEIIVAYEEYCVPIFSDIPDEQIAMLGDTGAVGIAATDVYDPVQIGQNVVIFGAGPIGLAAVQGAKAKAAGQIIVVEPARVRRDKALAFGATTVLDPNQDTSTLVERIRELCKARTDRLDAGGQVPGNSRFSMRGADLVIECSGFDRFPPKVEPGPDPSGLLALRQAWEVTAPGGSLVTLAVQNGDIAFPGAIFCLSGRRIFGGQMAGMNVMRDTPRFITAMEKGQVDIGALVTAKYPLEQVKTGFKGVADRTELGVVITFPT
ncbi:MAG TPA: zinc-binding dehydrogenase [Gammaproteobacteria bacterium]|nr:zinc-binding dehydrogenase [Gammaproteobacteria bacterium]